MQRILFFNKPIIFHAIFSFKRSIKSDKNWKKRSKKNHAKNHQCNDSPYFIYLDHSNNTMSIKRTTVIQHKGITRDDEVPDDLPYLCLNNPSSSSFEKPTTFRNCEINNLNFKSLSQTQKEYSILSSSSSSYLQSEYGSEETETFNSSNNSVLNDKNDDDDEKMEYSF